MLALGYACSQVLPARTLWHPVGKMAARAGPGKQPPGWVPSGLDPHDVGLGLYLRTSVCLISLESQNQDGGESPVTGGRQSSEVASVW